MLNNTKESDSSFQCEWKKYTDVIELTFCPEQSSSNLIFRRRLCHYTITCTVKFGGQMTGHYKLLSINLTCICLMVGETGDTQREHTNSTQACCNWGLNPRPSFCEAIVLTTMPLCRFKCFLLICDNRPPDGHSYDWPRDAAFWEHHGQIHHLAPPAQLPHRPVQQTAAHGEHARVR